MTGKTYVFNLYDETISQFSVHNNSAGPIAQWVTSSTPTDPQYVPQNIAIDRTKFPSDTDPSFAYGENLLNIRWTSYNGTSQTTIPNNESLDDDLVVFLTLDSCILVTTRGKVLGTTPVNTNDGKSGNSADESSAPTATNDNGMGSVYVFNAYNEAVSQILVNNSVGGTIAGWSDSGTVKYEPQQVAIARSKYPGDSASFAYGSNEVNIRWVSYNGSTQITVPKETSLVDDLIVYLTLDTAFLMDTRGHILESTKITTTTA